ncbi:MAG: hypothetical protein LBN43_07720 [Oscillospiraceae bacterium]|jgi:hypothetical protein|nr:hypothetical protein [Oscillospiraceae bacterium]
MLQNSRKSSNSMTRLLALILCAVLLLSVTSVFAGASEETVEEAPLEEPVYDRFGDVPISAPNDEGAGERYENVAWLVDNGILPATPPGFLFDPKSEVRLDAVALDSGTYRINALGIDFQVEEVFEMIEKFCGFVGIEYDLSKFVEWIATPLTVSQLVIILNDQLGSTLTATGDNLATYEEYIGLVTDAIKELDLPLVDKLVKEYDEVKDYTWIYSPSDEQKEAYLYCALRGWPTLNYQDKSTVGLWDTVTNAKFAQILYGSEKYLAKFYGTLDEYTLTDSAAIYDWAVEKGYVKVGEADKYTLSSEAILALAKLFPNFDPTAKYNDDGFRDMMSHEGDYTDEEIDAFLVGEVGAARLYLWQLGLGQPLYIWDEEAQRQSIDGVFSVDTLQWSFPSYLKKLASVGVPSLQKFIIDGAEVQIDAYNINNENYVKLRDVAILITDTEKKFEISFIDGRIVVINGLPYTPNGQEGLPKGTENVTALMSGDKLFVHGSDWDWITAYKINGANYYRLKDLGAALNAAVVDTTVDYDYEQ